MFSGVSDQRRLNAARREKTQETKNNQNAKVFHGSVESFPAQVEPTAATDVRTASWSFILVSDIL